MSVTVKTLDPFVGAPAGRNRRPPLVKVSLTKRGRVSVASNTLLGATISFRSLLPPVDLDGNTRAGATDTKYH